MYNVMETNNKCSCSVYILLFLEEMRTLTCGHAKVALILTLGGICVSGATFRRYFFKIRIKTSFICIIANRIPMQLCGP